MKKHAWLLPAFLILTTFLVLPGRGVADSPAPPRDYTKETENGEYLFVMLAPERWAKYGEHHVREKYKVSGLYRNDGSTKPLWSVYWYSFDVYPSSDGRHVVRMGPWASDIEDLAVSFHRDGKELKAYSIRDLVRDQSKLEHTVSHFFWRSSLRYDDKQGLLFLKTKDGRSYRFSVKTGEIEQTAGNTGEQEERVILREPVQVIARITKQHPAAKEISGSCELDVTVQQGEETHSRSTWLMGVNTAGQAFDTIKKGTRWDGKYLMVRTECGGGNAWRCNRDVIFTAASGGLRFLGEVFGGDREKPARSREGRYFGDIYDKLEMNGLTDHATAPAFWLVLYEKNGELKADLSRTWLRNREDFQRRTREIEAFVKGKGAKAGWKKEFEHRLLSNAVLAKYCEHKNEVAGLVKLAEAHLDRDRLEIFRNILINVDPGEYPVISEEE